MSTQVAAPRTAAVPAVAPGALAIVMMAALLAGTLVAAALAGPPAPVTADHPRQIAVLQEPVGGGASGVIAGTTSAATASQLHAPIRGHNVQAVAGAGSSTPTARPVDRICSPSGCARR